eukprot:2407773-Prymnesium_polylepis.2
MPAPAKRSDTCGASSKLAVAASAVSHEATQRLSVARLSATSTDEQAVSRVRQAPFVPSTKDSRPDACEICEPVAA